MPTVRTGPAIGLIAQLALLAALAGTSGSASPAGWSGLAFGVIDERGAGARASADPALTALGPGELR